MTYPMKHLVTRAVEQEAPAEPVDTHWNPDFPQVSGHFRLDRLLSSGIRAPSPEDGLHVPGQ
ncbi:MAG: hypothetical protein GEU93_08095 [Propionibacteriales bacterium]|nr:hypothetical protein [Propionibacteriales bacterium]